MQNYDLIGGHFSYSDIAFEYFRDSYSFITVLRNPVDRYLSAYFRSKSTGSIGEENISLSDFMKTELGKNWGHNYIRTLNGGKNEIDYYLSAEAQKIACDYLRNFDLVGVIEKLDLFSIRFKRKYGKGLRIGKKNKGTVSSDYEDVVSKKELKQLRKICEPDMYVYNYAINELIE